MGESLPLEMLKPQLDKPVTQLGNCPLCAELEASRSHILPQSLCFCWAGLQREGIKLRSSHRGDDVLGSAVSLIRELSLRQATAEDISTVVLEV